MTGWGWSGVMARAMAHNSEKEAAEESRNKEAAEESGKKKKVRRSKIERAMLYNSRSELPICKCHGPHQNPRILAEFENQRYIQSSLGCSDGSV